MATYPLDEGRYEAESPYVREQHETGYRLSERERAARRMRGHAERGSSWSAERERPRSGPEGRWSRPGPFTGRGPKGYTRSDERIEEDVCYGLTEWGDIDAQDIEIQVRHGEVTLKGYVRSRPEKRAAEEVAESVPGVRNVQNELHIEEYPHVRQRHDFSGTRTSRSTETSQGAMDMKAMMDVYTKLSMPGRQHKLLAMLEGSWTTKTKAWMAPDQPAIESTGTCEQKMLLGGRYLQQEYTGEMMAGTFSGINLLGYDNHAKKYVSTWIDTMSTGIYYFEGTPSDNDRNIIQETRYDDPVRGPMTWRSVTRIIDRNRLEYEMYLTPEGGSEEKMMKMTATRKHQEATGEPLFGDLSTF